MIAGARRFYRFYNLQSLNEVDYDYAGILADRKRTPLLRRIVESASVMRITTEKGTDLTCDIGRKNLAAITEILGLLPFFSEVATVPNYGTVNGVVVADGAVQKLRFNQFGKREISGAPIRMTIEKAGWWTLPRQGRSWRASVTSSTLPIRQQTRSMKSGSSPQPPP
jgi:hypothetical protein